MEVFSFLSKLFYLLADLPSHSKLVLRNTIGQVIQELDCSNQKSIRLETSSVPSGSYILSIYTSDTIKTFKLIK